MDNLERLPLAQIYELVTQVWENFQFHNGQDHDNILAKKVSRLYWYLENDDKSVEPPNDDYIDNNLFATIDNLIELPYLGMMQVFFFFFF